MTSKFSEFIEKNKIDTRRVLSSSRRIEQLRPEDRAIKLAKKKSGGEQAAKSDGDEKTEAPAKPRSGRPVTSRLLARATAGDTIPGPAKQRLLRAVNRILEQKKQAPVELRDLF
jgi:hypothetical protein